MDRRPGVAYRRPDGDPTQFTVEAAGESRLNTDALPQTDWLRVVEPDDRDRLRDALDGDAVDVTYRLTVDGESAWVHERGARDESGDIVGYLFSADDRVERRKQLEQQRERLEEFASVVSHDLRNPLSVAVGNIELAREFDGEEVDERLDRAHDALDWMDDLISDVLALAREGRSVEETATTDLRSVVDQAWRTVGAPEGVVLAVDEPLPPVECDRSRLRQALENLFRNAIEHGTPETLSVDPVEQNAGRSTDNIDRDVRRRYLRIRDRRFRVRPTPTRCSGSSWGGYRTDSTSPTTARGSTRQSATPCSIRATRPRGTGRDSGSPSSNALRRPTAGKFRSPRAVRAALVSSSPASTSLTPRKPTPLAPCQASDIYTVTSAAPQ